MITGKVESHTKAKNAFRIGDTWYNLNPGLALPDRFDVISFEANVGTDNRQYMTAQHTIIEKGEIPNFAGGGGGGFSGAKKGGGGDVGQQVGNSVTNAVRLVASGKVPVPEGVNPMTVILSLAGSLMKVGDKVKSDHTSGAPAPAAQAAPVQAAPAPVAAAAPAAAPMFDDDIPF